MALASYINPVTDEDVWHRMNGYPSDKISVLVANVLNGPDKKNYEGWKKVIKEANDSGKLVIGYVRTGYLGASWQHYKTLLGWTDYANWIAQIEHDVDLWYR